MTASGWAWMLGHFLLLSLLQVGGALAVAPDVHRLMVEQVRLLSDPQFNASVAIAQASPGPNVLYVAVIGYQAAGIVGALATMPPGLRLGALPFVDSALQCCSVLSQVSVVAPAASVSVTWTRKVPDARRVPTWPLSE